MTDKNETAYLDLKTGRVTIRLRSDLAPKHIARIKELIGSGFYDGLKFHRVIPGFMIQGGGYTTDFLQKPTRPPVPNEAEQSSKAGLLNVPGTIAMARTSDPHSATAQFFINVGDNRSLNYRESTPQGFGYTVFGKVVSGMDVVNKIAATPTGSGGPFPKDVPSDRVLIKSASIVTDN